MCLLRSGSWRFRSIKSHHNVPGRLGTTFQQMKTKGAGEIETSARPIDNAFNIQRPRFCRFLLDMGMVQALCPGILWDYTRVTALLRFRVQTGLQPTGHAPA